MDSIEQLLSRIKNDYEIMQIHFTGLMDDTANIFEKQGFGATKVFLLEKRNHRSLEKQANALLKVLEIMGNNPKIRNNRAIGRMIIKTLIALKMERRKDDYRKKI